MTEDPMIEDPMIEDWRASAIAPETADRAELELRRRRAMNEALQEQAERNSTPLEMLAMVVGQETSLLHATLVRLAHKLDNDRIVEFERLQKSYTDLAARLARLEPPAPALAEDDAERRVVPLR